MLCIDSQTGNPFYNLATEEILLKQDDNEYFILWESAPSVIVGKHQNALAEINYRYIRDNGILVGRRLSGGGTVFHGGGNLNYTFIRNGQQGQLVNFASYIEPILDFLRSLGLKAEKGPKHEIMVNGKKISGNAEHVYKNRVLHHGTLLFDADLQSLHKSIKRDPGHYNDKAVQSNRAEVINILECLQTPISRNEFRKQLSLYLRSHTNANDFIPDDDFAMRVNKLAEEKYADWDWIFGWSPDYVFTNEWTCKDFSVNIRLEVSKGRILQSSVVSRQYNLDKLNSLLKGKRHKEETISEALDNSGIESVSGKKNDDLLLAFF